MYQKLMNRITLSVVFIFAVLALTAFASASKTIINGAVYQLEGNVVNEISGADVTVTCNESVLNTISESDGSFYVVYNDTEVCGPNTSFNVSAYDPQTELSGFSGGNVDKDGIPVCSNGCKVYLGHADVWLIPEFSLVAGLTTIMVAIGAFYFVRRN